MNRQSLAASVAAVLAVLGLLLGVFGLYRANTMQRDLTTMQATMEASSAQTAAIAARVGVSGRASAPSGNARTATSL